jgi:hypothetical protein
MIEPRLKGEDKVLNKQKNGNKALQRSLRECGKNGNRYLH